MAGPKLSSKQQAQLAWLQTLPPKFEQFHKAIELMAIQQADEVVIRGLGRRLDELKANAQGLGLGSLADTAGMMGMVARRGGGLQMKVRALQEGLGSLKINYDGALRAATTPEGDGHGGGNAPGA